MPRKEIETMDEVPDEDAEAEDHGGDQDGGDQDDVASPQELMDALFMGNPQAIRDVMNRIPAQALRKVLRESGAPVPPNLREPQAPRRAPRAPAAPAPAAPRAGRPAPARVNDLVVEDGPFYQQRRQPKEEKAAAQASTQDLLNSVGADTANQIAQFPGLHLGVTFHPGGRYVSVSAFFRDADGEAKILNRLNKASSARLGDAIASVLYRTEEQLSEDEDDDDEDDGDDEETA